MNINLLNVISDCGVRVITRFGSAELMQTSEGKLQLRGGTKEDEGEAQEWISLCMHEAVLERPN